MRAGEWDTRDYWMDLYNKQLRENQHLNIALTLVGALMFVLGVLVGHLT